MKAFFENNFSLDIGSIKVPSYFEKHEFGEIFIEHVDLNNLVMQDGKITTCSTSQNSGFGIRKVYDSQIAYLSNFDISNDAILKGLNDIHKFKNSGKTSGKAKQKLAKLDNIHHDLYDQTVQFSVREEIELLHKINQYVSKNPSIEHSVISLASSTQNVLIILPDGSFVEDCRPLVKLRVSVVANKNGRCELGSEGIGGRMPLSVVASNMESVAQKAIDQALINTEALDAPTGEMPVVLSSGWTGVILHEAVGHGLEADFNRKGTSAFSGLINKVVASEKVSVLDDGTIQGKRGSLNFDDEGTPTQKTTLIENGVLKSYMFDRQNAALVEKESTGNGRRESFEHVPIPRMTNTYMLAGDSSKEEMIASVQNGIYAVSFSGGQVDIISGKFVFSASEAYLIESGKITKPIKGVSLIGDGPTILKKVSMVGNDFCLDPGVGTCGKNGQMVPVCVGQPSIKLDSITVGGTI